MTDTDSLGIETAAARLTAALLTAYATPGEGTFAWLPRAAPVEDDFVQGGAVNPLQVSHWVNEWFQALLMVDPVTSTTVGTADHDTVDVVTEALVAGVPVDPSAATAAIVQTLLEEARGNFGPLPPVGEMWVGTSPPDWMQDGTSYWATFDSDTASTSTTGGTPGPPMVVNPLLWRMRAVAVLRSSVGGAGGQVPPIGDGAGRRPMSMQMEMATRPGLEQAPGDVPGISRPGQGLVAPAPASEASLGTIDAGPALPQAAVPIRGVAVPARTQLQLATLEQAQSPVSTVVASSSSLHLHLEHQLVRLDRSVASVGWWPSGLFADGDWCIPGIRKGQLTASTLIPGGAPPDAVVGLPVALVVVRNVAVAATWSKEAQAAFESAPVTIGPFSFSPSPGQATSGSAAVTYTEPGMQVVAVLCQAVEALPPAESSASESSPISGEGAVAAAGGGSA